MKFFKKFLILMFIFFTCLAQNNSDNFFQDEAEFSVSSASVSNEKIKNQFLCLSKDKFVLSLCSLIQHDLNSTDQLDVDLKKYNKSIETKALDKYFKKGISLFTFLKENIDKEENINVVVKDTSSDIVLFEKDYTVDKKNFVFRSHEISSEIMNVLTGDKGPFLSSIAYCEMINPNQKIVKVSDYSCRNSKIIVPTKAISVAPRWHTRVPIVFYSQFTRRNNRLMSTDLRTGKHKVIFSYDGLNMQPSFSKDGMRAVMCLSAGGNSEIYLYDKRVCKKVGKRVFKKLTNNKGNNISPCLLPNNNVVFCSDFQTGSPQIFLLNPKNKNVRRLTNGRGYCAAPAYCEKINSIVYTRMLNGAFQLFSLDLNDLQEKQLTFDNADKREPTFSECGKYVIFSNSQRDSLRLYPPQIAILNLNSGRIRILTEGESPKSFPVWTHKTFFAI
ncbi:MAG: hypothetical protein ABIA74_04490 [bacterium]